MPTCPKPGHCPRAPASHHTGFLTGDDASHGVSHSLSQGPITSIISSSQMHNNFALACALCPLLGFSTLPCRTLGSGRNVPSWDGQESGQKPHVVMHHLIWLISMTQTLVFLNNHIWLLRSTNQTELCKCRSDPLLSLCSPDYNH